MIVVYPTGYINDMLHNQDLKENPNRHYLTKDTYSKYEALDLCPQCAYINKWNDKFEYDARTDSYYRIQRGEPT